MMKNRITVKNMGDNAIPLKEYTEQFCYGEPADRLSAYEDIGLEPEEIISLMEENNRLKAILTTPTTSYMTSPIGGLTVDSTGLRKAIDEIDRLRGILYQIKELIS